MKTHLPRRSGLERQASRRPESRFGPRRPAVLPETQDPALSSTPPDLEALEERAEKLGHHLLDLTGPQPIQRTRRSRRLAEKAAEKKPAEDEGEEEGEDTESEEEGDDDVSDYEGGDEGKKARQRQKARERQEEVRQNRVQGRAVDTSARTFGLGSASRAVSRTSRTLLRSIHSQEHTDITDTTRAIESASAPLSLPGSLPFVVHTALGRAKTVDPRVTSIKTSRGTLSRGTDKQRNESRNPGPKRLNYPQVAGLGAYGPISASRDRPSEELLQSLESARDPSSADSLFSKSFLRKRRRIQKTREKSRTSDLASQELAGANSLDPDIERLKTRNVGNTIDLLSGNDDTLAQSSSGVPVRGRDYHQSLSDLIARPGSPTREDEALRHSFRLARESEDLSGLRSPTPEEIQGHRGYSASLPTTWTLPPSTALPVSTSVAGPSEKKGKKKKDRKKKKRRLKKSDSDASSSEE